MKQTLIALLALTGVAAADTAYTVVSDVTKVSAENASATFSTEGIDSAVRLNY